VKRCEKFEEKTHTILNSAKHKKPTGQSGPKKQNVCAFKMQHFDTDLPSG